MSWFEEQIKTSIKKDNDMLLEACDSMGSIITGKRQWNRNKKESEKAKDAIDEILKYYHIKPQELPENKTALKEQLEYLLRPYGIMRRDIKLTRGWYKDAIGPMLGKTKEGEIAALLPNGISGYQYYDWKTDTKISINKKNSFNLQEDAICFYQSFPLKKMGVKDLVSYILQLLKPEDFFMTGIASFLVVLVGMLLPKIHRLIFSDVILNSNTYVLLSITVLMIGIVITQSLLTMLKEFMLAKVKTRMNIEVQSAAMMRVLSLPANFFRKFSPGELSERLEQFNGLCEILVSVFLSAGFGCLFSVVYLAQMMNYGPALVFPACGIILCIIVVLLIVSLVQMKVNKRKMEYSAKQNGLLFSLVLGVQKIKLAGAEKRAFSKWAVAYSKQAQLEYHPPAIIQQSNVIVIAISLIGTIVLYYTAAVSKVEIADYMAFNSCYSMVLGSFMGIASMLPLISQIKPMIQMIKPIMDEVPEVAANKKVISGLVGGIELNNISFRYHEDMPMVIDNISLKIKSGQYVAIVGATGCGKSTLMRLLLGFEKPEKGAVYYDGNDIANVDLKSLRKNIGVVMQEGRLLQGNVYSNIVISAPWLTLEDAWEAARLAGMEEDIKNMPMGMHTVISEGSGGISGGQRQRLMIARAIAAKPKILMFDEATSALDNVTQKVVSQSLASLQCTRIVIAHRLSTIKECDRIIVLEQGKIREEGTYQELLEQNGFFAELVKRQQVSVEK